jgi:multiple sugar transport system permease protein
VTAAASPASGGATAAAATRRRRPWLSDGRLFILPAIVLLVLMSIGPAVYLFGTSLFDFHLLRPEQSMFVGLGNYIDALTSIQTWDRLWNTVIFVSIAVSIEVVLGVGLALLLNRPGRDVKLAASLLLLPMAVTPVVAALIFRALLNPLYGWVDHYIRELGFSGRPIEWLSEPLTAWIAVIGLDVWQWTSFVALIVLAGLQGMDREPQEAASIDGAGRWQRFRYVTLPMVKPFIVIAVLLRTVEAFKVFGTIQVLTNGGPGGATEIFNLTIYRVALQNFQVGYGAALGIIFLILLSIIAAQLLRLIGRNTDLVEE